MTSQTQRRLILIRHAKAVEDHPEGDHARPLSARGRADAQALGTWLTEHAPTPQQVLCSTATRTRETCALLAAKLPVTFRDKLYLAGVGEILGQIQGADDNATTLMLVGHNPGMHGILALLTGDYAHDEDAERMVEKFPTAACAILKFECDTWNKLARHSGKLEQLRWSVDG